MRSILIAVVTLFYQRLHAKECIVSGMIKPIYVEINYAPHSEVMTHAFGHSMKPEDSLYANGIPQEIIV